MNIIKRIKLLFRPCPDDVADELILHLSAVSPHRLARLKRELRTFDARVYQWKE